MSNQAPNIQGLQQLLGRLEGAEATLRNLTQAVEAGGGNRASSEDMQRLMHLVQNLQTIQSQVGNLQNVVNNVPMMDVNSIMSRIQQGATSGQNSGVEIQEVESQSEEDTPREEQARGQGQEEGSGGTTVKDNEAEINRIQTRIEEIERSVRSSAESAGNAEDAALVVEQLTELQSLMGQLESVQKQLEEAENSNNKQIKSLETDAPPAQLEKLQKMFQERGLNLTKEEFKQLMETEEGKEMVAGIEQMNLLQQTIALQKEQLEAQEEQQNNMKRKAAHLRNLISESENEREMINTENGKTENGKTDQRKTNNANESHSNEEIPQEKVSTPVGKGIVKEVEGTPISQTESSEREFHMAQLRSILERQGLALSDEDFAHVMQTERGQHLLEKVKEVAESPNGRYKMASLTKSEIAANESSTLKQTTDFLKATTTTTHRKSS